jgi:hypothetical protein
VALNWIHFLVESKCHLLKHLPFPTPPDHRFFHRQLAFVTGRSRSNVEHRGHRKKWRAPGFREGRLSPYQPSQRKCSGTHTGVERPVDGRIALG